jgi:hypothetical protein
MSAPSDNIPDWMIAAQELRRVRKACLLFLDQWVAGRLVDRRAVDRVAADVGLALAQTEAQLADPSNHDWSLLYRGSVLDD